ncbi:MAG: hypothetical protein A2900_00015 [Candidatus Chisholmbacteria bacterium RIFCSPLOWO2_01_FULL_50_28]|uniref:Thioredoxin domain-containing protein n=1 Tax=Candidatus Chisholmbacteria bacterium RIFCSPHIGHO2_01_FULL_52_32 TaxID=1797591 RepID=A0A1G1VQZ9_9BACT|nr:MAG: hypothetical protein A2786_00250 [Candidatus Chisholmbacteria bacterium RIFCSPHIGHO2_01_FULL_52_32]OGY20712.1 MAG: hypothetical protein A2900_00015 [Candidatus Chisholmbacteria bacterium RIFCSPLOWO2_01_FULL_50_28]
MKIPVKLLPLLVGLLIVVVFLLGRYQGQVELLKKGGSPAGSSVQTPGAQNQQVGSAQPQASETLSEEQWQRVISESAVSQGKDGARVTIVEFTDYQCPYCKRHFDETLPQIEKDYIQTGKVKYLVRDFPLPNHPNAPSAAQLARCAGDQGKYWEMHDLLFGKQEEWSTGDPTDAFLGFGSSLGLNGGELSACLKDGTHQDQVLKDVALAQELGIGGTPGFYINGKILVGAMPFANFKSMIDQALQ